MKIKNFTDFIRHLIKTKIRERAVLRNLEGGFKNIRMLDVSSIEYLHVKRFLHLNQVGGACHLNVPYVAIILSLVTFPLYLLYFTLYYRYPTKND